MSSFKFKYADEKITSTDMMIAIPSIVIGVGVLSFPSYIAGATNLADGAIGILLGGLLTIFFTWIVAKLVSKFPNQSFLEYASFLVTKPVAYFITILFTIKGILIVSFQVGSISFISQQYLLDRTPPEISSLAFLLVVVYAVSGSRAGIFRLNSLFLPIIFFVTIILVLFSINYIEIDALLPVLTTDIKGYGEAMLNSVVVYSGYSILLFYNMYIKDVKKVPKKASFGMSWVVGLYLVIYLTCIAVFGNAATEVIRLPVIELAKSIEVPGGFFERMESIFFVIWITAIFTTTLLGYDIAVISLQSMLPKIKKNKIVFMLAPLVMFIAFIPNNYLEETHYGTFVGYYICGLMAIVIPLFWVMYGIKGRKQHEK